MEQRKHNIQVSDKLYNDIKSYCDVNHLKVSEYVEKLLRHEFTVDCYGPIPSIFVKDKEADKVMGDIIENVGGPEVYSKLIDECMQEEPVRETPPQEVVKIPKVVDDLINEPKTEPINEVINETPVVNKPKKKVTKLK